LLETNIDIRTPDTSLRPNTLQGVTCLAVAKSYLPVTIATVASMESIDGNSFTMVCDWRTEGDAEEKSSSLKVMVVVEPTYQPNILGSLPLVGNI